MCGQRLINAVFVRVAVRGICMMGTLLNQQKDDDYGQQGAVLCGQRREHAGAMTTAQTGRAVVVVKAEELKSCSFGDGDIGSI